jgi:subfamily B ATP-binding cassette protein HlyB/CyaB
VLIFDEATSSLDDHTAELLGTTINRLATQASILFVTHALPRSLRADRVIGIAPPASNSKTRVRS